MIRFWKNCDWIRHYRKNLRIHCTGCTSKNCNHQMFSLMIYQNIIFIFKFRPFLLCFDFFTTPPANHVRINGSGSNHFHSHIIHHYRKKKIGSGYDASKKPHSDSTYMLVRIQTWRIIPDSSSQNCSHSEFGSGFGSSDLIRIQSNNKGFGFGSAWTHSCSHQ